MRLVTEIVVQIGQADIATHKKELTTNHTNSTNMEKQLLN